MKNGAIAFTLIKKAIALLANLNLHLAPEKHRITKITTYLQFFRLRLDPPGTISPSLIARIPL